MVVLSFNYFKIHAWSTSMLICIHYMPHFVLTVVKMLLKGEVGGRTLNSHRNYIVDHGKSWKNHGIVILNFCGNPALEINSIALISSHHCIFFLIFKK